VVKEYAEGQAYKEVTMVHVDVEKRTLMGQ
jgi:hypothetical protein